MSLMRLTGIMKLGLSSTFFILSTGRVVIVSTDILEGFFSELFTMEEPPLQDSSVSLEQANSEDSSVI